MSCFFFAPLVINYRSPLACTSCEGSWRPALLVRGRWSPGGKRAGVPLGPLSPRKSIPTTRRSDEITEYVPAWVKLCKLFLIFLRSICGLARQAVQRWKEHERRYRAHALFLSNRYQRAELSPLKACILYSDIICAYSRRALSGLISAP